MHGTAHRHVYGANLGVRADAYLAVGGFPRDGAGEDHGCGNASRPPATRWPNPSASGCGRARGCAAGRTAGWPVSCAPCTGRAPVRATRSATVLDRPGPALHGRAMTPDPEPCAPPDHAPDVERALAEFVEHLRLERGRSPHTVRAYRADLAGLLAGLPALRGLDLARLRGWLADAHAAGAARSTLARKAAAARTFTAWAHRRGLLSDDPGARLVAPRPRSALPRVLDHEQTAAVLDATGAAAEQGDPVAMRDRLVVELLYATG